MPPSLYRPLPVDLSQAPPGAFGQKPLSYDDVAAQNAQKLAAQLALQKATLESQDLQRKSSQEQALVQGLVDKFGNQNDAQLDTIDPKEIYKVMNRVAAKTGNYDKVVDLARATKENATLSDRIMDPVEIKDLNERYGFNLPPGTTIGDARLHIAMRNANTATDRTQGIQKRFDVSFAHTQQKEEAPGIFDNLTDEKGNKKIISAKQQDYLSGIQTGLDTIIRNSSNLINEINDDRYPIGDKLQMQKQLIANMLPALRKLDNQGVRFNEFLRDIDIQQLGDEAGLVNRIVGTFTGQDPAAAINRFILEIVHQSQMNANANNATISKEKLSRSFPELVPLWENLGVFDSNKPVKNPNKLAESLATDTQSEPDPEKDPEGYKAWYTKNILAKKAAGG